MAPTKTLVQRERELQALLATAEGRKVLQDLEERYSAVTGRRRTAKASVITYIIVCEREQGLISR